MPLPGDRMPPGIDWIGRKFRELERRITELAAARSAEATTIGRGGLLIKDDGALRMVDDNGVEILYLGPDANGKQVIRLRREGGADVMFTYDAGSGVQYWALTDNANNQVIADDALSGEGLARPYIPGCTSRGRYTDWLSTSSATFDPLHKITFRKMHPKLSIGVRVTTDLAANTTGTVQARVADTGQIIGTAGVGFVQELKYLGPTALTGLDHMQQFEVWIEAKKTAGDPAGVVRVEPAFFEGVQS